MGVFSLENVSKPYESGGRIHGTKEKRKDHSVYKEEAIFFSFVFSNDIELYNGFCENFKNYLSRASTTATMYTLNNSALLQFSFRHPANAIRAEICVPRLDATQAAQILVARFLPLGYQISVGNFLSHTVIVQLATDGLSSEE